MERLTLDFEDASPKGAFAPSPMGAFALCRSYRDCVDGEKSRKRWLQRAKAKLE